MSQWDGMPENPPPVSMMGKRGRKAQEKVRDAVIAMGRPPTDDQVRAITELRQAVVTEVHSDEEFAPGQRIADLEGELLEHVNAIEALLVDLGAQRGALRWSQDVRVGYRPVPVSSNGPSAQLIQRPTGTVTSAQIIAVLREALGVRESAPVMVGDLTAANMAKAANQTQAFGRYGRAVA
jgi:hypothetical protein